MSFFLLWSGLIWGYISEYLEEWKHHIAFGQSSKCVTVSFSISLSLIMYACARTHTQKLTHSFWFEITFSDNKFKLPSSACALTISWYLSYHLSINEDHIISILSRGSAAHSIPPLAHSPFVTKYLCPEHYYVARHPNLYFPSFTKNLLHNTDPLVTRSQWPQRKEANGHRERKNNFHCRGGDLWLLA